MSYYMGAFLLLFIIIFIVAIIVLMLVLFVRKVKHGLVYLLTAIIVLSCGLFLHHQIANRPSYNFNKDVCATYPKVKKVDVSLLYGGQTCKIYVWMKETISDEDTENLFIDLMKRINEEPLSSYIKKSAHSKYLIIEFGFMGEKQLIFRSEQYLRSEWFTEENQKVQAWYGEGIGKTYHYSDYLN